MCVCVSVVCERICMCVNFYLIEAKISLIFDYKSPDKNQITFLFSRFLIRDSESEKKKYKYTEKRK